MKLLFVPILPLVYPSGSSGSRKGEDDRRYCWWFVVGGLGRGGAYSLTVVILANCIFPNSVRLGAAFKPKLLSIYYQCRDHQGIAGLYTHMQLFSNVFTVQPIVPICPIETKLEREIRKDKGNAKKKKKRRKKKEKRQKEEAALPLIQHPYSSTTRLSNPRYPLPPASS